MAHITRFGKGISFILMTLMCVIWGWYCKEKLDASHSQVLKG